MGAGDFATDLEQDIFWRTMGLFAEVERGRLGDVSFQRSGRISMEHVSVVEGHVPLETTRRICSQLGIDPREFFQRADELLNDE